MAGTLAGATADSVRCTSSAGQLMIQVHCTMRSPGIIGLLDGVLPDISVTGHTLREHP
jgi:hypothetical protein